MPPFFWVVIGIFVLSAIVGAVSKMLNNMNEANANAQAQAARQRPAAGGGAANANAGGGGSSVGVGNGDIRRALSEDGSRISFISPGKSQSTAANPSRLYMRIDGESTVEVSRSQCDRVAPEPPCNAPAVINYQDAASDGSRVLFATTQQLVNDDLDALSDVYSYDVEEDSLARLSPDIGGATFVMAASDDAQVVYLMSPDKKKIYLSDHGAAPRLVAVTTTSFPDASACNGSVVSERGDILVFNANFPVEDAAGNPGTRGLYRYDAAGSGTLTQVGAGSAAYSLRRQSCSDRFTGLSVDGEYLVFNTSNKLLP